MAPLTQKNLAAALGCTVRQLHNHRKAGLEFDLTDEQCIAKAAVWIYLNTNPNAGGWSKRKGEQSEEVDPLIMYKLKLAELEERNENARARRLKNEETEGRLIDTAAVEHRINEWTTLIRSHLMNLGDKVSKLVPGELKGVVKKQTETEVRNALKLLHEEGELQ